MLEEVSNDFRKSVLKAAQPRLLSHAGIKRYVYDIHQIKGVEQLPYVLHVLLENIIRTVDDEDELVRQSYAVVHAGLDGVQGDEISFMPSRVLFQDFTGVPVFVDFAAMRDAAQAKGIDPKLVNPKIPATLIVDHSVIADVVGCAQASNQNEEIEVKRNYERFSFLKWASKSFDNVEIVPPGGGICHQLNIERFCKVVTTDAMQADREVACFDTLVGTDSHTTTANGIGVLGWGVGGIEAEAACLGTSISMLVPEVIELRLTGALKDTVSGMDVALSICERLRAEGVVGALVEVTGESIQELSATQRACIANMTPEYGSTTTFFPVDDVTMAYLALTGRDQSELEFARAYLELEDCFGVPQNRRYAKTIIFDLSSVTPCLAGPSRPHNRVDLSDVKERFDEVAQKRGTNLEEYDVCDIDGEHISLGHGTLALAAITSCTTATDPAMMLAAGLIAKAAHERGLKAKPWVKCILAPGSKASQLLLERAGLLSELEAIGFYTTGFGCMSCIGNSGDIHPQLHELSSYYELASVLSGNRNFDGRISPDIAQNYLAQPALVVAFALAGTVRINLEDEAVGFDHNGAPVMLFELMPSAQQIEQMLNTVLDASVYAQGNKALLEGSRAWQNIEYTPSDTFTWDTKSTYIRRAPYFDSLNSCDVISIRDARVLVSLGDFVTTDHISPAGSIALDSPCARYLEEHGVGASDFNTYGARRGNHEVMMRGTFANVKLENKLAHGQIGPVTRSCSGDLVPVFDAAMLNKTNKTSQIVLAGKMYGSGSSRDWAAKGPALLGVKAVIAESFERIHRSNLIQMGIVPLQFEEGQSIQTIGLTGEESFSFAPIDLSQGLPKETSCLVVATRRDNTETRFTVQIRVDTPLEGKFLACGGILPYVLDHLA